MTIIEAILLGIIQGITEFLPISSTAHLTLAGKLMNLVDTTSPESWTAFIAMMQLGTAGSILIYFWKDYINLARGVVNDVKNRRLSSLKSCSFESRLALYIIIGTIPVAFIGFLFHEFIEGTFTKETSTIATSLIALAILLTIAEKISSRKRNEFQTTWLDALVVGIAQVVALIPGSSRSGTTITAGLFMGLDRETAARFSFHLSIPAILASGFFQMYQSFIHLSDIDYLPLIISTIVSGIVGYISISFLLYYLRKNSTLIFILYRIVLGLILWTLIMSGLM